MRLGDEVQEQVDDWRRVQILGGLENLHIVQDLTQNNTEARKAVLLCVACYYVAPLTSSVTRSEELSECSH